jgi:hypothetical protein
MEHSCDMVLYQHVTDARERLVVTYLAEHYSWMKLLFCLDWLDRFVLNLS